MALSAEQQAQVDTAVAIENARHANQLELLAQQAALASKQTKLETLRMAKEILLENARSKSVDAADVTAADVTTFANSLFAAV